MLIKSQVKAPELFSLMIIVFNLKDCHSQERMFSLCEPLGQGWRVKRKQIFVQL